MLVSKMATIDHAGTSLLGASRMTMAQDGPVARLKLAVSFLVSRRAKFAMTVALFRSCRGLRAALFSVWQT